MARHLFLVSRHEARLYEYLLERFRDDGNVEVILDRRRGERRGRPQRPENERRRSDRRTRREVDLELQVRSHVILTLPEDDSAPRL
jgi:transcription termination factor Rho